MQTEIAQTAESPAGRKSPSALRRWKREAARAQWT